MMDCCPNCGATELHMQYFDEVSIIYRCALCNASFDQHEVVYCEDKGDYETLADDDDDEELGEVDKWCKQQLTEMDDDDDDDDLSGDNVVHFPGDDYSDIPY